MSPSSAAPRRAQRGCRPLTPWAAGSVIVWDADSYRNLTEDHGEQVPVAEAISAGTSWSGPTARSCTSAAANPY